MKLPPSDFKEFNDWLGLPEKNGHPHPIYEYELEYLQAILNDKHVILNKARGIGMTEITLRIILWMALTKQFHNKQFAIVAGTRLKFAVNLVRRLKAILAKNHKEMILDSTLERIMFTTGHYVHAYPAEHIDAIRGMEDVALIFIDEAAFFDITSERQDEIKMAIEGYRPKTNPYIVYVSTPNGPQGLFYDLDTGSRQGKYDYRPIEYNYLISYGLLLEKEEIEAIKAKNPRTFAQEYMNQYIAPINAATPIEWIEKATKEYEI